MIKKLVCFFIRESMHSTHARANSGPRQEDVELMLVSDQRDGGVRMRRTAW